MRLSSVPMVETAHPFTYQCSGCNQLMSSADRHIILALGNNDGTLQDSDFAFSYFHNEHCVAQCILHGETYLNTQSSVCEGGSLPPYLTQQGMVGRPTRLAGTIHGKSIVGHSERF